ncbi:MAG TPA: FHA domain-containing protein [Myxococcota bacterium]
MAAAASHKPVASVPSGASIEVMRGFYEGLELAIDRDWFVIGRGRGADAILAEATISRAHAAIGFDAADGFFVQDLGSTNGTLLNGERHKRKALQDGDQIQIGKLVLRVALPSSGAAR